MAINIKRNINKD